MLLLVLPVAVSDRLDSLAGRLVQMGCALKASVRVLIGAPDQTFIGQRAVPIVEYSSEQSPNTVNSSPMALVHGPLLDTFPSLAQTTTRLIVDLSESVSARSQGCVWATSSCARRGGARLLATGSSRERSHQRRARRNGDLRRLIDVVGTARQRQDATDGCCTTDTTGLGAHGRSPSPVLPHSCAQSARLGVGAAIDRCASYPDV